MVTWQGLTFAVALATLVVAIIAVNQKNRP